SLCLAPCYIFRRRRPTGGSAGIHQRRAELGEPVQLAEVRRAEAGRVVATQGEVVHRLPAQATLIGNLAAEGRVVRVAYRATHAERGEHRQAELGVGLFDVVALVDREGQRILRLAILTEGIWGEDAVVLAVLGTYGDARRPILNVEDRSGDVRREQLE